MQLFRDLVHGFFGKAILALVIALFVLYGTEALVSLASKPQPVATVNDASLFREQLIGMIEQEKQLILRQNLGLAAGFPTDEFLRSQVVQRWVNRQLIDYALLDWGVRPDQAAVIAQLQSDSRFAVDGVIQQEALETWLRGNGMGPKDLFQQIRVNLGLDRLITALESSEFIVPYQTQLVHNLQTQIRNFKTARIAPSQVKDQIKLDAKALEVFYSANMADYMQTESASVSYLEFSKAVLEKPKPATEAVLKGYYETYKQNLKLDEKRQASHILIDTSARDDAEALAIVQSILKRLEAGESFADMVTEFSDDKPSVKDGGALPMAEKGTFVPEFEDALYALELNQVSAPVKTDFGYHLIRLDVIEALEPVTFADKKAELELRYLEDQQAEAFSTLLDEIELLAFESPNLEQLATQYKLEIKTTADFSKDQPPAALDDPELLEFIFNPEFVDSGRNSELIVLDERALVLFPKTYKPAAPKPFAEVKQEIRKDAEFDAARTLAEEKGRAIIAKLKIKQALTESETKLLGEWTEFTEVDRRSTQVSVRVIQAVFAMAKPTDSPSFSGFVDDDDFVLVEFSKVGQAKMPTDTQLTVLSKQLQQAAAEAVTVLLIDALKDGANIVFSEQLIR